MRCCAQIWSMGPCSCVRTELKEQDWYHSAVICALMGLELSLLLTPPSLFSMLASGQRLCAKLGRASAFFSLLANHIAALGRDGCVESAVRGGSGRRACSFSGLRVSSSLIWARSSLSSSTCRRRPVGQNVETCCGIAPLNPAVSCAFFIRHAPKRRVW